MSPRAKKILMYTAAALIIIGAAAAFFGYTTYQKIVAPNVKAETAVHIYVPEGATYEQVIAQFTNQDVLRNPDAFAWWAKRQGLPDHLKRGHYLIETGMSNREIVNLMMSGRQTPVRITFNNMRTKQDFAGRIAQQLDLDSASLLGFLDTTSLFTKRGFTPDNLMTVFIPNTYELYWTATASEFVERMLKEHDAFWTAERINKAEKIGLSPEQVYILASIVYSENERAADEAPRIAGVYMNRILSGMKLEADPTVKFAIGDFTIKRLLFADLEIESPYNTYKYHGLPPGPIHMPPIAYIDAVLNYEQHDYIFMCANGDGSGYHLFAKTLAEHNRNRDIYIQTLNKKGIRR